MIGNTRGIIARDGNTLATFARINPKKGQKVSMFIADFLRILKTFP